MGHGYSSEVLKPREEGASYNLGSLDGLRFVSSSGAEAEDASAPPPLESQSAVPGAAGANSISSREGSSTLKQSDPLGETEKKHTHSSMNSPRAEATTQGDDVNVSRRLAVCYHSCGAQAVGTLLYCGDVTGTDMGLYDRWMRILGQVCKLNTLAFDYTGYGLSESPDVPSEKRLYQDTNIVYRYLIEVLGADPRTVIIYGRGTGSGPAVQLAYDLCKRAGLTKKKNLTSGTDGADELPFAALVLQSPMKSVLSTHTKRVARLTLPDMFENHKKAYKVLLPVLIVHGTNDELIPYSHGESLADKFHDVRLVAIEGGTHWNLEQSFSDELLDPLIDLINELQLKTEESTLATDACGGDDAGDGATSNASQTNSARRAAASGYSGPPIVGWLRTHGLERYADQFVLQLFVTDPLFLQSCTDAELLSAVSEPQDRVRLFAALGRTLPDENTAAPSAGTAITVTNAVQQRDRENKNNTKRPASSASLPSLPQVGDDERSPATLLITPPPGLGIASLSSAGSGGGGGGGGGTRSISFSEPPPSERKRSASTESAAARAGSKATHKAVERLQQQSQASDRRAGTTTQQQRQQQAVTGDDQTALSEEQLVRLGRTVSVRLNRLRLSSAHAIDDSDSDEGDTDDAGTAGGRTHSSSSSSSSRSSAGGNKGEERSARKRSSKKGTDGSLSVAAEGSTRRQRSPGVSRRKKSQVVNRIKLEKVQRSPQTPMKSSRSVVLQTNRIDETSFTQEVNMLNDMLHQGLLTEEDLKKEKRKLRKKFKHDSGRRSSRSSGDGSRKSGSTISPRSPRSSDPKSTHRRTESHSQLLTTSIEPKVTRHRSQGRMRALSQTATGSVSPNKSGRSSSSASRNRLLSRSRPSSNSPKRAGSSPNGSEERETEKLTQREYAANEFLSTEREYVRRLDIVVEGIDELRASDPPILTEDEIRALFSEIKMIRDFNAKFLSQLAKRIEGMTPDTTLGDLLVTLLPFLHLYQNYIRNYQTVPELYKELRQRNKRFRSHCIALSKKHFGGGSDYDQLLSEPYKRIPQYSMLVQQLVKLTPSDQSDYPNLVKSYDMLQGVASKVQISMAAAESFPKKEKFHKMLKEDKFMSPAWRQYYFDCPATIIAAELSFVHLALFSDLLVFFTKDEKDLLVPSLLMDLDKVWLMLNEQNSGSPTSPPSPTSSPTASSSQMAAHVTHTSAVALLYPENSFFARFDSSDSLQQFVDLFRPALEKQIRSKYANANVNFEDLQPPFGRRSFEYRLRNGDVYQGEWQDGLMNGNGIMRRACGDVYTGRWRDGLFSDFGDVRFATGETYVGNWLDGLPHAMGKVTSNGKVYLGHFERGQKCGRGKLTWDNGWSFQGQWQNDLANGRGELRDPTGAVVYAGELKNGMFCGRGVLTTPQGVYEGELAFNDMHGHGLMKYANGSKYEGPFEHGQRSGSKGHFTSADGSVTYEGDWKFDQYHGQGRLTAAGQFTYIGSFEYGQRHGEGKLVSAAVNYTGSWERDLKHGLGVAKYPDESSYDGTWAFNLPHGRGKWINPAQEVMYRGEWRFGARHGVGQLEGPANHFSGEFVHGLRHGDGLAVTLASAAVYKGAWKEGQRDGPGTLLFPDGTRYHRRYTDGALQAIDDPSEPGSLLRITHLPNAPGFPPRF